MQDSTIDLMEAAARLRVGYPIALRLVLEGAIVGERVNGHWRCSEQSVAAAVERRAAEASAKPTGRASRAGR